MSVERITIDSDESGFLLYVSTSEETFVFNIQDVAESLYDQARSRIGPWLRERDETRRAQAFGFDTSEELAAFAREAYEASDPKHPDHHSVHVDRQ